jgi:hypothetical protein
MEISKKRIRNLNNYLPGFKVGRDFRVGVIVDSDIQRILHKVGFPEQVSAGESLVPAPVGAVSEFNAHGRDLVRRDLPKQPKSYMVHTTWNDWHGHSHSGIQNRTVDAFPVEHVSAPEEPLTIAGKDGKFHVVSKVLKFSEENTSLNLHIINLFLEVFSHCSILGSDISVIELPELKRLSWQLLPPGEYPWSKAKDHVRRVTESLPNEKKGVIEHRLKKIAEYRPDFMAIGQGGFSGYFVLGFTKMNLTIFESIHLGNATYVFSNDWEALSMLTKKEILEGNLQTERLIHDSRWEDKLRRLLRKKGHGGAFSGLGW